MACLGDKDIHLGVATGRSFFRIANADIQGRRIANPPKLKPKQKPILNFGCKDNEITQLALLIILLTKKLKILVDEKEQNTLPLQNELAKKQATRNPLKIID